MNEKDIIEAMIAEMEPVMAPQRYEGDFIDRQLQRRAVSMLEDSRRAMVERMREAEY